MEKPIILKSRAHKVTIAESNVREYLFYGFLANVRASRWYTWNSEYFIFKYLP